LDRSGAEKQLLLLAAGLVQAGDLDVHVCALSRGGPLEPEFQAAGAPAVVIGKRGKLDPRAYWQLKRHIVRLRPNLVQTWLFAANAYGRAAALQAGVKHLVAGERSVDPWKSWHQLAIDRLLARRTAAIVVNSPGVRDFYVRHGLPPSKFRIIPNGVPASKPSGSSRAGVLAEFNLPAGTRLIGVVCRLWPQKRVKDLIWAADLLQVVRPDVHVLVIGEGPQRTRLERFAEQCTVAERVHFLGLRHDVPRLMPHFDLLWLASGYEGLPNVVMEALAAGVPVVASDIPGNRDLVVQGQNGFLVPAGDRAGFGRFANKILNDPALAAAMGAAGRERMTREFSVERMVSNYAELYRELLQ